MNEIRSLLEAFDEARGRGASVSLATVVRVHGSSYRRPGARMLITSDGEISGSVSGGCLERDLLRRGVSALQSKKRSLVVYDTSRDADDDEEERFLKSAGLGCEGIIEILLDPNPEPVLEKLKECYFGKKEVEIAHDLDGECIFLERLAPPQPFLIFGAGHDAVAMSRLAMDMGWDITVYDFRSSFPIPRRYFNAASVVTLEMEKLSELTPPKNAIAILMTHNYEHDRKILRRILSFRLKYIGLLGPRTRGERMLSELRSEGVDLSSEVLSTIHSPVGFDLGGDGPAAIALAAIAEMQATLSGRPGSALRERSGPIHS